LDVLHTHQAKPGHARMAVKMGYMFARDHEREGSLFADSFKGLYDKVPLNRLSYATKKLKLLFRYKSIFFVEPLVRSDQFRPKRVLSRHLSKQAQYLLNILEFIYYV
jgi:hypothetical protein